MKAAYYREVSSDGAFEAIGFINNAKNSAMNQLLLKPVGADLVAYLGVPDAEFQLQAENNFSEFDDYFKTVVSKAYKRVPYVDATRL